MRTLSAPRLFLFLAGICAPYAASAQCPDGTLPPCRRQTAAPRVPPPNSVAVLYFASTSSDSADSYIADGLTDEIIVRLARVQRLDVKSRNEVRRLANTRDTRTLLQQLDVAYLVSGSVQPTPTGLRVRVELTRGAGMRAVWGASFQRADVDLAAITAAIADSVAQGVIGQLLPGERQIVKRGGTKNAAAYDFYLRALSASRHFDYDSFMRAEGLFAEAVRIDSTFADAWAARAYLWGWIADAYAPPPVAYPRVRQNAARALRLDSTNALAWAAEADVRLFYDWNAVSSLEAATRAARLDPRLSSPQLSVGVALGVLGDTVAAVNAMVRAFLLDTLDEAMARVVPQFLDYFAGRSDEALRLASRIDKGPLPDRVIELRALFAAGRCLEAHELSVKRFPNLPRRQQYYDCPHPGPEASARVDSILATTGSYTPYLRAFNVAFDYLTAGNVDKALPWLERAIADRDWCMRWSWGNIDKLPGMAPILADPRLVALRRRVQATPPLPLP